MPPELVLPAFVLVLVANAVLIGLAIRAFTGDHAPEAAEAPPARPIEAVTDAALTAPDATPMPPDAAGPMVATTPARPRARASRAAAGRRRRRFAMPPMEEDHERFNRSIAAFLSGGKSADGD
jgi:hypothetical protein